MNQIGFNKPFFTGKEQHYISEAVEKKHLSGNGHFTKKCHAFFQERYGFKKCLLTHSCTAALEMAAILINIQPGDEVIIPSYTFVSTANAFVLRGAKIVFCDSYTTHPNVDHTLIEGLITPKTKAIVVVHYAGVACDMDPIMDLATEHGLFVIEDAAQAIDSFYKGRPLGSIGHLAAFSFHETKNISSGEGGLLVVNDEQFEKRAEVIWEKGTNRAAFWRGEVDKYTWVDIGSSFLPSDIIAAFLFAQLENIDLIQQRRKEIWAYYFEQLDTIQALGVRLPYLPDYATNNGHLFYLICRDEAEQVNLLKFLKENGILAVFHYLSLHKSPFFSQYSSFQELPQSDRLSRCLIRLPFYFELGTDSIQYITQKVRGFYGKY